MNVIKSSVVKKSICLFLVTAFIIVLAIPFYATQDNLRWVQLTAVSVTFELEGQLYRISGSAGSSDPNGRIDLNVELQKKENGVWTVQSGSTWHSNGVMSAYCAGCKVVLVPDQSEPEEELKDKLYGCVESLDKIEQYFL